MAAIDIFAIVAPEYAATPSGTVAAVIALAAQDVNASVFGAKADRAIALLAAHMLTIAARGGNQVGPMVGQKFGDVEVRYAAAKNMKVGEEIYASTSYGVEFLRVRRSVYRGPLVL